MFKKYPRLENVYQKKFIDGIINQLPHLKDVYYIITEKRDGSNIQLIFNPDGQEYKIASRNRILENGEDFYGIFDVLGNYSELTQYLQELANTSEMTINVYGEVFGKGIQKRIDYGDDRYFEIFDIYCHDDNDSFFVDPSFIYENKILSGYMVPVFGLIKGIDNALSFEPEGFNDGKFEGLVIKPYRGVYYNKKGNLFCLKKKSPLFSEKGNKEKKKEKPKFSEDVEELHQIFGQYINKNRVLSIFSKHGEIEESNQIGDYIKLTLEDAKEDFFKSGHIISEKDAKEIKYIFNHSKKIVPILQEYL